jgi:molybdopterin/thiamine biosynthesis adenylyltransferase
MRARKVKAFAEITDYLIRQGFSAAPASLGALAFKGILKADSVEAPVTIEIPDWTFRVLPGFFLDPDNTLVGAVNPHVGPYGYLCYATHGEFVLNSFAPASAMARCLEDARATLKKIVKGGEWAKTEIQREFRVHWGGSYIMSSGLDFGQKTARMAWVPDKLQKESDCWGWVYQDKSLADQMAAVMGHELEPLEQVSVALVRSDTPLYVTTDGPPKTIGEFLRWVKGQDRDLYGRVENALGTKAALQAQMQTLLIEAANTCFGICFKLTPQQQTLYRKKRGDFLNQARKPDRSWKVIRVWVEDASPAFIHSRSLLQPDLSGKMVALIGAGAIGGYLADNLARLGAGAGQGKLLIIDPESLAPENIGRHRLGLEYAFQPKASSLKSRLEREFPWLNIEVVKTNAEDYKKLWSYDLVVDATGEVASSRILNLQHLDFAQKGRKVPKVLYCWVAGSGDGCQAFWVDDPVNGACYECLMIHGAAGAIKERFKFLNEVPAQKLVGCKAVTPYAAGMAMSAAALASEMICDWLIGNVHPRFRTRARSRANVNNVPDSSPAALKRCPACSPT